MIKEKLITNELIRKTFNEEIPYGSIDMDFMNENQSAHGGREYGHIVSRMGIERKVIVGHWADKKVQRDLHPGCVLLWESWKAVIYVYAAWLTT